MALKKWNTNFRLESVFHPDKQDYLFRCSVSAGKTQKVVFHLLSNQISQKMFVNGKQPLTQSSPLLPLIKKPEDSGYEIVDDALISLLASFPRSVSTLVASCNTIARCCVEVLTFQTL